MELAKQVFRDSSHAALFQSDDSDGTCKVKRIKGKSSHFRCASDDFLYFGIQFSQKSRIPRCQEDRCVHTVRLING